MEEVPVPTTVTKRVTTKSDPEKKDVFNSVAMETLVTIEVGASTPEEAVEWLAGKIRTSRRNGGAELLLKCVEDKLKKTRTLHVGGSRKRLLLAAELMELKKPHNDGSLHEVALDHIELFQGSDDLDTFLTMCDKQRIVLHELESIRAQEGDTVIPGVKKSQLYLGQAIVPKCVHDHLISQVYPLHDKDELKILATEWYRTIFRKQPIEKIQEYFGDTVAMYFSFLGFYTIALVPPAIIGLLSKFFFCQTSDLDLVIFFSVFNLVWATLFLEGWKRNCSVLAYKWGTINTEPFEEARAAYYGTLGTNKITDRLEPKYPKWKRVLKFYGVSVPVVLLCLVGAIQVMLWYFYWEGVAIEYHKQHDTMWSGYLTFAPTIVYSVIIIVLNALYRMLAIALNDWENHRLESAYENHLITKLLVFDFVNCFLSLFYIAFVLRDMKMLRTSLATLLVVQQVIQQAQETLVPYLFYKYRKRNIQKEMSKEGAPDCQPSLDAAKEAYQGTLDDYLELFLQFGYVFLFSAVYPAAAFWALLNNVVEIRSDAFKLCRVFQRPFGRPTAGIGAWQMAFEVMGVIAVMTNCALVALSPNIQNFLPGHSAVGILILFVCAEHVILFMKLMIAYVIPDEPEWVQTALQRIEFQSKRAWRKQRYEEARKTMKSASSEDFTDSHKHNTSQESSSC